jgi:hypothetical protein
MDFNCFVWAAIGIGQLFRSIASHAQLQPRRLSGMDVARELKKLVDRPGFGTAEFFGHSRRVWHIRNAPGSL